MACVSRDPSTTRVSHGPNTTRVSHGPNTTRVSHDPSTTCAIGQLATNVLDTSIHDQLVIPDHYAGFIISTGIEHGWTCHASIVILVRCMSC